MQEIHEICVPRKNQLYSSYVYRSKANIKGVGYLDADHTSTQPKLSIEQQKGKDFICRMKTFQVLLGCLLIIHLQYNAWAAPSQVDNTDYWETDVDNQDIHHRLEALEEYVEYQISEAVEGVTIIPTNQSHVINKRFDYFQYLRDTNFVECKCNLLKLHANIFSFINVSYTMYEYTSSKLVHFRIDL